MLITKQKTAIITGATGYIGSQLTKDLISKGWNIHIICRTESNLVQVQDIVDALTIHFHDGTTEQMKVIFEKARPNVVFHLASLTLTEHKLNDIEPLIKSNILFGNQVVEAMVQTGCYQLINTSTYWQNYEGKQYSPVCLYAATKQAFETILQFYLETSPLSLITLTLSDTYGPNDPRQKLIPLMLKASKNNNVLLLSPGFQYIDLVYIDDIINAYNIAALRFDEIPDLKNEKYTVSSEKPLQIRELVKIFEDEININLQIKWGGKPYRSREVMFPRIYGEILPGWRARINLKEGIKNIILKAKTSSIDI